MRSPENGWKNGALTPANEKNACASPSSANTISTYTGSRRNFERQYQYRRRATMSSALRLASAPNRLGVGISLRAITSIRPRNVTTATAVTISATTTTEVVALVEQQEERRAP